MNFQKSWKCSKEVKDVVPLKKDVIKYMGFVLWETEKEI
jgi:hypothetical protein